jgi:NADPH2:quinone reductase
LVIGKSLRIKAKKAIRVSQFGGPEVLKIAEVPEPAPARGQALVRIKASGINFIDIYQRRGEEPEELPYTPGLEASGIVESVGEGVDKVKPGDRVAYTSQMGAYAEASVVQAQRLIPLPADFSFEQGAAFPCQGMTAHYLLHAFRTVKPGDVVLIHAAAGGMGLLLVQWAKHLGALVIGTVSTEEKAKAALEAGANHVIFYNRQNFVTETRRLTDDHGADLIIDGVGGTTFEGDLEVAALRGHVVVYGEAGGLAKAVGPYELQNKSLTVSGALLSHFTLTRDELLMRADAVLSEIKAGRLRLRTDHAFSLAEAAQAHRLLEGRQSIGKVLLRVPG